MLKTVEAVCRERASLLSNRVVRINIKIKAIMLIM